MSGFIRRVVAGHDQNGKAGRICSDEKTAARIVVTAFWISRHRFKRDRLIASDPPGIAQQILDQKFS